MIITPGKQMTEAEAEAPIRHLEGRFSTRAMTKDTEEWGKKASEIGVDWFAKPEGDGTSWITFRGPAELTQILHEYSCELSGDEPNVELNVFDSRDALVIETTDGE